MHYDSFGGMYYLHNTLIHTLSKNDMLNPEIVFRSILTEDERKDVYVRQLTAFTQTCKKLCDTGFHLAVLKFMHSVFMYRDEYDIAVIGEKLREIKLRGDYTLAELCSDYYKEALSQHYAIIDGSDETEELIRSLDLYAPDTELPVCRNGFSADHYDIAYELVCRKVWGFEASFESISFSDIDRIAASSRAATTEKHNKLNNMRAELRKDAELREKKHGRPSLVGKPVVSALSEEYRDSMLPGALIIPFILCEKHNMSDECFYMLEEYILPYLYSLSWNESDRNTSTYALILRNYVPHFEFLINRSESPLCYSNNLNLSASKLYRRVVSPAPEKSYEYCKEHCNTFYLWSALLHKSEKALLKYLDRELYSRQIIGTAYLMDIAGETEKATDLLIRHYEDLRNCDSNRSFAVTVLARCLLSTDSLTTANTLYGYFCSEEAIFERDRRSMTDLIDETVSFLKLAKAYIKENDQQDTLTDSSIYDMLYSDDRIDGVETALSLCAKEDRVPDRSITAPLFRILDAFALKEGINLGRLGYDRHDTFDQYVSGGLCETLRLKAADLYERGNQFINFRLIISLENFRQCVNMNIQDHIIDLQCKAILEHLAKVDELRQMSTEDNDMSEEIIRLTEALADKLKPDGYDRAKTERLIRQSHRDFCDRFYPDTPDFDILNSLQPDIRNELLNYFVTSEMIFRYLSEQGDESLDFTPALISLTKALEYVLFCAYEKFDVSDTVDVDSSVLGRNLERGDDGIYRKLPHLELGNLIYLLKDGKQIHLDKPNRSVRYPANKMYSASHFKKWNNGVFNIGELKRFAGLDITVSDYPDSTQPFTVHFVAGGADADDTNRATLAKALEYVKDNYRNPAAHKDRMPRSTVNACRELMLSSEQLLWILLAVTDLSSGE